MFSGSLKVTIDDKGRLAIPTRYRGLLADGYGKQVVVTMSPECTVIYPLSEFRGIVERIPAITDRPTRMAMHRLFLGSALEQELDAQGRVQIPLLLRERMGLPNGGDAVLVGLNQLLRALVQRRIGPRASSSAMEELPPRMPSRS